MKPEEETIMQIIQDVYIDGEEGYPEETSVASAVERIDDLLTQQREEAVLNYRINYEKGVQEVVENTVAKDRVKEIKKEAVEDFAHWCESNKLGSCVLFDAKEYTKSLDKGNKE